MRGCCWLLLSLACCAPGRDGLSALETRPVDEGRADAEVPDPTPREPEATRELELRLDRPQPLSPSEQLTWTAVEDSRCPTGVTCVWAGEVRVELTLSSASQPLAELELVLGPRGEPRGRLAGWQLELLAVEPHPRDGVDTPREQLQARVQVERPQAQRPKRK